MSHAEAKPAPGGPPPFEPSVQNLTALTSAAQAAIGEYETASTPAAKATALRKLQQASAKLTTASTPPQQQYLELALRPHLNGALRIAIEMGAFNALPQDGTAIALGDIAKKMNAEEDFVLRIMRVLAAYNLVAERDATSSPAYSHSALSRFMCNPMAQAGYKHLFHTMLPGGLNAYPGYFKQNGFQNPPSSKNAPITFAEGKKDMTIFDLLEQDPTRLEYFHTSMAMVNAMSSGEAAKTYPFDKLEPNSDGIVYVDVGGGKGQTVKMVKEVYPQLKGKVVVQDLPEVVSEGLMLPESEMIAQPYDFLKEEQPIKGAPAYFLKWIFHDWPDSACQTILRNLAPAMRANSDSRLLVCDRILPDRGGAPTQVLSDMNMLVIGGKERSVSQFQRILESEGFKIVKIWGEGNAMNGIVEAMLA